MTFELNGVTSYQMSLKKEIESFPYFRGFAMTREADLSGFNVEAMFQKDGEERVIFKVYVSLDEMRKKSSMGQLMDEKIRELYEQIKGS